MDRCACRRGSCSQLARVFQRMEMTAATVHAGCGIDVSADHRLCMRAIQHPALTVAIVAHEIFGVFRQRASSLVVVCRDDEAAFQLAVLGCKFENELASFFAETPKIACVSDAQPLFQLGLALAMAWMDLSAISPRCTEADVFCLNHNNVRAGCREMQRRR